MKILRFDDDQVGVLKNGESVVEISGLISNRAERGPQRVMEELIENFSSYRKEIDSLAEKDQGVPLQSVMLLAPIPRPSKCLAAFVNYLDKPGRTVDQLPNEFFHKAPELVAPEGDIVLPSLDQIVVFHAEAELAFVVGKHGKDIAENDAMDYVFGYTCFFDVSARGTTRRSQFFPKGQDTFSPCGPWITTADEIPDPHNLRIQSWLNGEARQDFNSKDMAHYIPDQIAWLTRFIQLQPGDVIATGTHHNGLGPVNCGEMLEIEIEKIGRTRFFLKGDSPRKDVKWAAGMNKPVEPGLSITRI